ncbi:MAG: hypothetical protein ACPGEF_02225 [Endozoicomonas sp.]
MKQCQDAFQYVHNELFPEKLYNSLKVIDTLSSVESKKQQSAGVYTRNEIDGKVKTLQLNLDDLKEKANTLNSDKYR